MKPEKLFHYLLQMSSVGLQSLRQFLQQTASKGGLSSRTSQCMMSFLTELFYVTFLQICFRGVLNGQTVAVKKVKLKEETDIKHLRHLSHPNIIKFLGVCTQAPCYCVVMEYCPNGQLGDILKSDRVIEWCSWSRQIAEGMEYLHKNKVIHRDLKSPNILFDEDGVVKICDFGTSHQQKKQNSTVMSFCGTVSWMAPEVIKKQPCCEKVDVFSYGVVLWELLTREQPYKNINQMAIIYGVVRDIMLLPSSKLMLMRQCWSATPRNRPSFTHIQEFFRRSAKWRADAANIQYPETITKGNGNNFEKELIRKRREELKHAQDIREMYENKLKRTNKMYSKLTDCMNELLLKEKVSGLFSGRNSGDERRRIKHLTASSIRSYPDATLFSSSGFPSSVSATFSRQSSSRSSIGLPRRRDMGAVPAFSRSPFMRHSSSSQYCGELVRNSPARTSGMSEDSGVQMWNEPTVLPGGQPVRMAYSQTLIRNQDGRWSDGRIVQRRKPKRSSTFQRDSPARIPQSECHNRLIRNLLTARSLIVRAFTPMCRNGDQYCAVASCSPHFSYNNPIYHPPVTSCANPLSSPENADLCSSLDSNNPSMSDASAENSSDDEKDAENGYVFLLSSELIMMTSSSTMASSLERSLEQGAMHSDGLSDKERRVRAVKNTIRGHRRTQSNPQNVVMSIVDETSSEADSSDDAVDI
ncbi:unnamed protein product [Heligmosomoides polygyrus]|uniref:Protein kinase domain-containing protein n=1 Tax=Heligmosomoides polygyrus TaxID=6339 RepID=A0A183GLX4_HELPZ|nr:unnamed protein product [Heligmosomoides polygyrus]